MNNITIKRLLHTVLPFMIMNMVQRSVLLVCRSVPSQELVSLSAFIAACLAGIFAFSRKTFTDESEENLPLIPRSIPVSVMLTVSACAFMVVLMYASSFIGGTAESENVSFTALGILSTLLIHPILEEIVFRKLFYGELRLMNRLFGCIAQTLMFAILHSTVDGMIYALCCGLVLALLYEHTGRILPCIIAHIFINLRSLLCLTLLSDLHDISRGLDIALITAGIVTFCVTIRMRAKTPKEPEHD